MIPLSTITAIHDTLLALFAAITPDTINGGFELLAGFFVLNHCRVLHAHKQARGVSLASVLFFTLWGLWNLYYYPSLHQPLSYYGGWFVVAANALYVGMMIGYRFYRLDDDFYLGSGK